MALIFITIDPETDSDHCPAVFVEEETGDLLFQGGEPACRPGPVQASLLKGQTHHACSLTCG